MLYMYVGDPGISRYAHFAVRGLGNWRFLNNSGSLEECRKIGHRSLLVFAAETADQVHRDLDTLTTLQARTGAHLIVWVRTRQGEPDDLRTRPTFVIEYGRAKAFGTRIEHEMLGLAVSATVTEILWAAEVHHAQLPAVELLVRVLSQLKFDRSVNGWAKSERISRRAILSACQSAFSVNPELLLSMTSLLVAMYIVQSYGCSINQAARMLRFPSPAGVRNMFRRHFGLTFTDAMHSGGLLLVLPKFLQSINTPLRFGGAEWPLIAELDEYSRTRSPLSVLT